MTKCRNSPRGFFGGAISTRSCTILTKFLHPELAELLNISATVRVAVAAHDLSEGIEELYLTVKDVAIGIVPRANTLAIVLAGSELERSAVILKAREVSHWFGVLHETREGQITLPTTDVFVGEGEEVKGTGTTFQDFESFTGVLQNVLGTTPIASWLAPLRRIPCVVMGALLDFTLSDMPIVTVPAQTDVAHGNGDEHLCKWSGLWNSVAASCRIIAEGRRDRRLARRKNRQDGEGKKCWIDEKTNHAYIKFPHTKPPLDVYIKLVRLPEHDPCLVAVCSEEGKQTSPKDYLDDLESLLAAPFGLEEPQRVPGSVDDFPATVQAALHSASSTIKQIFPKPKSLALRKQRRELQHRLTGKSGVWTTTPVPPETPREGLSPKAARRFGLGRLPGQPAELTSDDSATNSVEVEERGASFDSVDVMLRELSEFGLCTST